MIDTNKNPSKTTEGSNPIEIDLDVVGIDEDFDDGLEGSKVITKNQVLFLNVWFVCKNFIRNA